MLLTTLAFASVDNSLLNLHNRAIGGWCPFITYLHDILYLNFLSLLLSCANESYVF